MPRLSIHTSTDKMFKLLPIYGHIYVWAHDATGDVDYLFRFVCFGNVYIT